MNAGPFTTGDHSPIFFIPDESTSDSEVSSETSTLHSSIPSTPSTPLLAPRSELDDVISHLSLDGNRDNESPPSLAADTDVERERATNNSVFARIARGMRRIFSMLAGALRRLRRSGRT